MLEAAGLTVHYGAVRAIEGIDVRVAPGEVTVILGANGAGKTTTVSAIAGLLAHDGTVTVDGQGVTNPVGARTAGIALVPQGRGLFRRLTVEQNLRLGALGLSRTEARDAVHRATERIPELTEWGKRRVGSLSGGEQALVALGRLLASQPRYALLDEPTLSLSPLAVDRLYRELEGVRSEGVGILLVEQYVPRALTMADRLVVLERGSVVYDGDPAGAGDTEQLVHAYLTAPTAASVGGRR